MCLSIIKVVTSGSQSCKMSPVRFTNALNYVTILV